MTPDQEEGPSGADQPVFAMPPPPSDGPITTQPSASETTNLPTVGQPTYGADQ